MKLNKSKKGISLIVLIITIIVMIILATAIILTLNGSGIIDKAKEAKTVTDDATLLEAANVAVSEWEIESRLRNTDETVSEYVVNKLKTQGFSEEQISKLNVSETGKVKILNYYTDKNGDKAPVPNGFTVSQVASEQTVNTGLVIIDSYGNEFVWVPVDDFTKFKRTTTYDDTIAEPDENYTEPFNKITSDGITLSLSNDLTGEWKEFRAMRASVQENKGFYIGRYEAGTTIKRTGTSDGTTELLIQKDKPVYNFVGWGPSMIDTTGNINSQGLGAVELSRNMYKGSDSVVSTLCFGVQWDAVLQFIHNTDPTFPSTERGNNTGVLVDTGYYSVNNIYDMVGNVTEWTMEAYSNNTRALRGGEISGGSADTRASEMPDSCPEIFGFRVALYLK